MTKYQDTKTVLSDNKQHSGVGSFFKKWKLTIDALIVSLLTFYFASHFMFYHIESVLSVSTQIHTVMQVMMSFAVSIMALAFIVDFKNRNSFEGDDKEHNIIHNVLYSYSLFTIITSAFSFIFLIAFDSTNVDFVNTWSMVYYVMASIGIVFGIIYSYLNIGDSPLVGRKILKAIALIGMGGLILNQTILLQFGQFVGQTAVIDGTAVLVMTAPLPNPAFTLLNFIDFVNISPSLIASAQAWAYVGLTVIILLAILPLLVFFIVLKKGNHESIVKRVLTWGVLIFFIGWTYFLIDAWIFTPVFGHENVLSSTLAFDPAEIPGWNPGQIKNIDANLTLTTYGNKGYAMTYLLIGLGLLGWVTLKESLCLIKE